MNCSTLERHIFNFANPATGEIWMLHRVVEQRSEKVEQRELEVTPEWLKNKIQEYLKKDYSFVPICRMPLRGKWVCVTFDDGYQDSFTHALPLMKQLGIPFTVYVTTGFIDNRLPMWWYPDEKLGIGSEELLLLDSEPLCTIGAHTVSHPKLDTLNRSKQYQEIFDSCQQLENLLHHPVMHFSLPHGAYSGDTLDICQELELQTVVTSWGGRVRQRKKYLPYPRINIVQP